MYFRCVSFALEWGRNSLMYMKVESFSEPECHHDSVLVEAEGWMFLCRVLVVASALWSGEPAGLESWFNWWWGKNLPVLSPHTNPSAAAEGKTLLRPPRCAMSTPTFLVLAARYNKGLVAFWALSYVLGEVACSPETWPYQQTYRYEETLLLSCIVQFSGSEMAPAGWTERETACAGGWESRGSRHNPNCNALGFEMMTENFPACICSHLATACSPGCFSRRVWSVLAKEGLLFPKHAYHFVLDNDGNFRHFFSFRGKHEKACLCRQHCPGFPVCWITQDR